MDEVQTTPEPKDPTAEDWVIVDRENTSTAEGEDMPETENLGNNVAIPTSANLNENITTDSAPTFEQGVGEDAVEDFNSNDFGEGIDFGDLATAGEELSGGYTPGIENVGLEEQGDLTNEGAFGKSFQVLNEGAEQEEKGSGI